MTDQCNYNYILIDDINKAISVIDLINKDDNKMIVIDIEFTQDDKTNKIGISTIQISTKTENYIFDIYVIELELKKISNELKKIFENESKKISNELKKIFENESITKLFFSGSCDLMLLYTELDITTVNYYDLQDIEYNTNKTNNMSLVDLINKYIGSSLFDKQQKKIMQQSDWVSRPLSDEQLKYSINDTCHLINIFNKLTSNMTKEYAKTKFNHDIYKMPLNNRHQNKNIKLIKQHSKLNQNNDSKEKENQNQKNDLIKIQDDDSKYVYQTKYYNERFKHNIQINKFTFHKIEYTRSQINIINRCLGRSDIFIKKYYKQIIYCNCCICGNSDNVYFIDLIDIDCIDTHYFMNNVWSRMISSKKCPQRSYLLCFDCINNISCDISKILFPKNNNNYNNNNVNTNSHTKYASVFLPNELLVFDYNKHNQDYDVIKYCVWKIFLLYNGYNNYIENTNNDCETENHVIDLELILHYKINKESHIKSRFNIYCKSIYRIKNENRKLLIYKLLLPCYKYLSELKSINGSVTSIICDNIDAIIGAIDNGDQMSIVLRFIMYEYFSHKNHSAIVLSAINKIIKAFIPLITIDTDVSSRLYSYAFLFDENHNIVINDHFYFFVAYISLVYEYYYHINSIPNTHHYNYYTSINTDLQNKVYNYFVDFESVINDHKMTKVLF